MASRSQYVLRIGGTLEVPGKSTTTQVGKRVTSALGNLFSKPDSKEGTAAPGTKGGQWPTGFLLNDYCLCQWDFRVDQLYPEDRPREFTLSFRAEVHHVRNGSLFDNKAEMLKEVAWFYHYRDYGWWKDLLGKLEIANAALQEEFEPQKICPFDRIIWFQDWQWYCGNSGS